jgi:hypothetical protein
VHGCFLDGELLLVGGGHEVSPSVGVDPSLRGDIRRQEVQGHAVLGFVEVGPVEQTVDDE